MSGLNTRIRDLQPADYAVASAGAVGTAFCALLAVSVGNIDAPNFFGDPMLSLIALTAAALLLTAFALRPLWAGTQSAFAPRFVVALYFILLLLGAAALSALRLLASAGYPIASSQRLPTVEQTIPAFTTGLLGGACLLAGLLLSTGPRGPRRDGGTAPELDDARFWTHAARVMPVLIGVGFVACVALVAKTGQIAILAPNIDATRYEQGAGLGFISLLQYELLLAACIGVAGLVLNDTRRRFWLAGIAVSLGALVVFRVERTPVLVSFLMLIFVTVVAGRRVPRRMVVILAIVTAVAIGGLGLFRYGAAQSLQDRREAVTRPLFDVAPEFREQAFVYRIYPQLHGGGYMAARDLGAIASSVIPSGVMGALGVDKAVIYTDVSREYSETMRTLGYYPNNVKPLRVGLIGELYADFGYAGVIGGMALFGFLLGRFPSAVRDCAQLMRVTVIGVFAALALVTPLPALLPISLIVVGTLVLVTRWMPSDRARRYA